MAALVHPDGTLNETLIAGRETLYTGMNGQSVERLLLHSGGSVIYKPLTNDEQQGMEAWVYEHVLPLLPPIYPQLLAQSPRYSANPWCLFEDLGPLEHRFEEQTAAELVALIASWHALPVEWLQHAPLHGPKPPIESLLADVLRQESAVVRAVAELPAGAELLKGVLSPLRGHIELPVVWTQRVFSHGDLHLGNYAVAHGKLSVLDWEHAHLNCPYWDLYHVIDLSHPVFPKSVEAQVRERLLDCYVEEAASRGMAIDESIFKQEYARFAAVFSLWMLLLIEKDLAAAAHAAAPAKWSPEQLSRQRAETLASFEQCARLLI